MKEKSPWLNEMIDAALEDKSPGRPDFQKIFAISESIESERRQGRFSGSGNWMIPAAAIILAAIIATPIGIFLGRVNAEKIIQRETTELFVDSLVGDSLFEEGLMMNENWFSDITIDENFFDI